VGRPYIRWEPGANADMIVLPGDGPLIVSADDEEKISQFAAIACSPPVLWQASEEVGYVHRLDSIQGASPQTGIRARGYDWLPESMSFWGADPVAGEPDPISQDDTMSWMYAHLGWRMFLRGYIGAAGFGGLNMEFKVEWADSVSRAASDPRGAWTGICLGTLLSGQALRFMSILHGKRSHEANWIYHGTYGNPLSWPPSDVNSAPWNGIDSGKIRFVISGGSPSWQIVAQYWDGGAWQDLNNNSDDLFSGIPPGYEQFLGVVGSLFSGPTAVNPIPATVWPVLTSYFDSIQVSQFQPFIIDTAIWTLRHINEKFEWLIGPTPGTHYGVEPLLIELGRTDLFHFPPGSGMEPTDLRTYDRDVGWAMRFGQHTLLGGGGPNDRLGIAGGTSMSLPLVPAEVSFFGSVSPFATIHRWKFEKMDTWAERRGLVNFGKTVQEGAVPAAGSSGIGFFWEPASGPDPNRLIARIWNEADGPGVWTELEYPFEPADWNERPVDIGIAWTGARGIHAGGRPDYEFRLLINGRTVASAVVGSSARIEGSARLSIGASPLAGAFNFTSAGEGLWAGGACYFDAMSDYELGKALDWGTDPFANPSFETASTDGRPGEAERWDWQNIQQVGQWADFNSYDIDLDAWYRAMESFEAGWSGNQLWVDLIDDLTLVEALFNALSGPYKSTIETFDLWSFPPSYTGPPWRDDFQEWRTDDPDQPGGAVGFASWYDEIMASVVYPLGVENFDEAWGNDPLSTARGPLWQPDTAPNGRLIGRWFSFPITIAAGESKLLLYRGSTGEAVQLDLTSGTYADETTLLPMLDAALAAAIPAAHALSWGYEQDTATGECRLTLGWDQSTVAGEWFLLMTLEREFYNDAREVLGLDHVGSGGRMNGVDYSAALMAILPLGVTSDDVFVADMWSYTLFDIVQDPATAEWFPLVYLQLGAIFDTLISGDTYLEQFLLTGWFGAGAVWKSSYTGPDLTAGIFDFGTPEQDTIETFISSRWPDEIWT